ncbi:hypothetical protein F1734_11050 [Rhodococcus ruber]|uniref:Uncharacterized protein n=1 Tax=Rhodococcus pyridinivorans AK37 TaxID=1114960 RepID=H0JYU7_9NOCA|nr:hypothetical protein DCN13_09080 [Rhodococcus ruber]EHK80375.1 hypothetical protein AK37_24711 [Rhodococcus pyridinivorans AK37]QRE80731.1 hypothetical protein F1734_11050 [Rhodococcus ruber]
MIIEGRVPAEDATGCRDRSRTEGVLVSKKVARRAAALAGLVAAPVVLGATVGPGTAAAAPWRIGPLYRAEFAGPEGSAVCSKAEAFDRSIGAVVLVSCSWDPAANAWFYVAFNPRTWS